MKFKEGDLVQITDMTDGFCGYGLDNGCNVENCGIGIVVNCLGASNMIDVYWSGCGNIIHDSKSAIEPATADNPPKSLDS